MAGGYRVKELVREFMAPADRARERLLIRRVIHWAMARLVTPINPGGGTGVHRRYDQGAGVDCLFLSVLADAGMAVEGMRRALKLTKAEREVLIWALRRIPRPT